MNLRSRTSRWPTATAAQYSCGGRRGSWCRIIEYRTSTVPALQVRPLSISRRCPRDTPLSILRNTAVDTIHFVIGFYYVCVDFNPQPSGSIVRGAVPASPETDDCALPALASPAKAENVSLPRDTGARLGARPPSAGFRSANPVPTMSGFYFHQNSEPCVSSKQPHSQHILIFYDVR